MSQFGGLTGYQRLPQVSDWLPESALLQKEEEQKEERITCRGHFQRMSPVAKKKR